MGVHLQPLRAVKSASQRRVGLRSLGLAKAIGMAMAPEFRRHAGRYGVPRVRPRPRGSEMSEPCAGSQLPWRSGSRTPRREPLDDDLRTRPAPGGEALHERAATQGRARADDRRRLRSMAPRQKPSALRPSRLDPCSRSSKHCGSRGAACVIRSSKTHRAPSSSGRRERRQGEPSHRRHP